MIVKPYQSSFIKIIVLLDSASESAPNSIFSMFLQVICGKIIGQNCRYRQNNNGS